MSTGIYVTTADQDAATALIAVINGGGGSVSTITDVLNGALTVGLNRLLSNYTNTNATRLAAMGRTNDAAALPRTITPSAADTVRIAALVAAAGGDTTTADAVGAAVRTGINVLTGVAENAGPIVL